MSKNEVRLAKIKFAKLPTILAMQAVKCGFELETQLVDGYTLSQLEGEDRNSDNDDGVFDQDSFDDHCSDLANATWEYRDPVNTARLIASTMTVDRFILGPNSVRVSSSYSTGRALRSLITAWIEHIRDNIAVSDDDIGTLASHLRAGTIDELTAVDYPAVSLFDMADAVWSDRRGARQDLLGAIQECISAEESRENFTTYGSDDDSDNDCAMNTEDIMCPDGVTYKSDGSVSGPEFITKGNGTTASRFSSSLRQLFKNHTFKIDNGCSFHIHVSIPGITHKYGKLFQAYLMEYLLGQIHRLPESVKARWNGEVGYFKPLISKEKYSFVHFHESLGTWEFRCFGNVQNHADGMRCLKLAVEAMQYAYQVQLKRRKSAVSSHTDWSSHVLTDVLKYRIPAVASIKERRLLSGDRDDESSAA